MQLNGHNYLVPADAQISTEQTVRLETVDVDAVIDQMSVAKSRVNLVILDACRNSPYERRFRSPSGGLASIEAPTGTMIAYTISPGKVAADGEGSNGLYTSELLAAMDMPGPKLAEELAVPPAAPVRPPAANASGYPVGVGQSFRDCADCPELVVIPAGEFQMGSDKNSSEKPMHRVRVGQALAVGKFPVMVGEYARFVQETGHGDNSSWRNPGFAKRTATQWWRSLGKTRRPMSNGCRLRPDTVTGS